MAFTRQIGAVIACGIEHMTRLFNTILVTNDKFSTGTYAVWFPGSQKRNTSPVWFPGT